MTEIKVSICQSNYIPWRGYFDLIGLADYFVIFDSVQYTKNDWRNRNVIKSRNGNQWLTIPCTIKSLQQTIYQTEIANPNWFKKHLNTIRTEYAKSDYFTEIFPWLEYIYTDRLAKPVYLSEVNKILLEEICTFLEIKTKILSDSDFKLTEGQTEKLLGICKDLKATTYLSGPAAKNYLDTNLFEEKNIRVEWMDYDGYKPYQQLHGNFAGNVSIIDLLFNEGPNSKYFLKSYSNA